MNSVQKRMVMLCLGGTLVACGGGGGSSSPAVSSGSSGGGNNESTLTETVTISASLGRITDATVKIYDADYDQIIGEGVLDAEGKAQIQVTYNQIEPAIVEVTAGENSSYFDESAGQVALPEGTKLHAMTDDPSSTAVTPLTELAWQLAQNHGSFPLDADRVNALNFAVSNLFIGGMFNINRAPTILSEMPATNSQSAMTGDLYAALLGALATLGDSQSMPVMDVLADLKLDVADGVLNDFNSSYVYSDFGQEFRQELEDWVTLYGTKTAKEAIFALPLPDFTLNYRANIPARERVASSEYGVGYEIAASIDGQGEWALFPKEDMFSYHREGTIIGVAAGDTSMDPDSGEFISGWSVDIETASLESLFDEPGVKGVRVEIPTGDPDIKRFMMFVSRNGLDLDDLILIEDDVTTFGSTADRVAHAIGYAAFDFMEPGVQSLFNDLNVMASNGDSLTVVKSDQLSRICAEADIGTNDNNRYPKLIGLIFGENDQEVESLEPQRLRYAEAGPQREILIKDDKLFRINDDNGRVDVITFSVVGGIKQWATNDGSMIAEYCP